MHNPKSSHCYAYDESTLHIRMLSAQHEVEKVVLWIGDPYDWAVGGLDGGNLGGDDAHGWTGGQEVLMTKEAQTQNHDCWFAEFQPPKHRARYGFILYSKSGEQKLLFGEKRCVDITDDSVAEMELSDLGNFYCFPFINPKDVLKTPGWVKNTVWYHIFPERYHNGRPELSPADVQPWGSEPDMDNFMGGDLWGIIEKLDYLQELGVNGLYLCPIFTANANHKYDTIDYYNVDPGFGGNEAFIELVAEAHRRGMKVMLDAVFNHVGDQHPFWLDVVKHGEASAYADWFWIEQFPVYDSRPREEWDNQNLRYKTFGNVASMPKWNTENEQCRAYLLDVARHWVDKFDIDGWRLDVANEVDHEFWREFRRIVKAAKPDCYILGEIWHNAMAWLGGDQYDSVMNYPMSQSILDYFALGSRSKQEFIWDINRCYIDYPRHVSEVIFNLLDSHDTSRLLSVCSEHKRKAMLAYLFMFTQAGSPCIYYGGEIGMSGSRSMGSEGNRGCMVWDENDQDLELKQFITNLIKLRQSEPSLNLPWISWIDTGHEHCLAYQRGDLQILINNSEHQTEIKLAGRAVALEPFGFKIQRVQEDGKVIATLL